MKITIADIQKLKNNTKPFSVITAYDYPTALIINETNIPMVLVGDSASMVVYAQGYSLTAVAFLGIAAFGWSVSRRWTKNGTEVRVLFTRRVKSMPTGVIFIKHNKLGRPISFSCHSLGASKKRAITNTAPVSKRRKFAPKPKS